jgi:hypothetical protein
MPNIQASGVHSPKLPASGFQLPGTLLPSTTASPFRSVLPVNVPEMSWLKSLSFRQSSYSGRVQSDLADSSAAATEDAPHTKRHLIVMQHGLFGSRKNWEFIANQMRARMNMRETLLLIPTSSEYNKVCLRAVIAMRRMRGRVEECGRVCAC